MQNPNVIYAEILEAHVQLATRLELTLTLKSMSTLEDHYTVGDMVKVHRTSGMNERGVRTINIALCSTCNR